MSTPPPVPAPPPQTKLLCVCAWCGRWRDDAGAWHEPPHPPLAAGQRITHGMCPLCEVAQTAADTVQ